MRNDMVDETKLQVTIEMYKKEIEAKIAIDLNIFKGKLKEKLQKRCKVIDIEERMQGKVQYTEFTKNSEKLNDSFKLLEGRLTHMLNVQRVDMLKGMERKAESREVELLKKNKVDKESFQELIHRMDELEEYAKNAMDNSESDDQSEDDDTIVQLDTEENKNGQNETTSSQKLIVNKSISDSKKQAPKNQTTQALFKPRKLTGTTGEMIKIIDDRSDHTFGMTMQEEFKKQINVNIPTAALDDAYDQVRFKESQSEISQFHNAQNQQLQVLNDTRNDSHSQSVLTRKSKKSSVVVKSSSSQSKNPFKKKSSQKVEKIQTFVTQMFDDIQKRMNENRIQTLKNSDNILQLQALTEQHQREIEGQSADFNKAVEQINQISKDIQRLERIDVKLNKELVQKPFQYIDKVKADFEKDWAETKKKFSDNNEKYMGKFVNLENNVSKLLVDTQTLLDQYKKKIGQISSDLQGIKTIRDQVESKVTHNNQVTQNLAETTKKDIANVQKELLEMKERLRNEIGNLKEENHGFIRELQRNQQVTRELQQEFMKVLNEKKKVNDDFITNLTQTQQQQTLQQKINMKIQSMVNNDGKNTLIPNDQSLQLLLPQLKAQSSVSNQETLSRQIKLNKLFSEKKSVDYSHNSLLNSVKKNVLNNLSHNIENAEEQIKFQTQTQAKQKIKSKTPLRERGKTQRNQTNNSFLNPDKTVQDLNIDGQSSKYLTNDQRQFNGNMSIDSFGQTSNEFHKLHKMIGDRI
ncbi:UNKNOWN [Stylonychia lemnae]|uniref:Uncharacterized protein n=1 Tax=Stylonychia lemnae TaxID=5949 RepID=A0A078AEC7_STYLE|nr:UNKNOWN [Stylonychia lemnae]|eukprot:CDW80614.1 UNKNOWN [Stylonychia lemnae]